LTVTCCLKTIQACRTGVVLFALIVLTAVPAVHASSEKLNVTVFDASERLESGGETIWKLLLDEIAVQENWSLHYVQGPFSEGSGRIADGSADLLTAVPAGLAGASPGVLSQETVISTWSQIYTHEDVSIQSVSDLDHRTVGVLEDDVFNRESRNVLKGLAIDMQMVEFRTGRELVAALENKWIDAAVVDRFYSALNMHNHRLTKTAILFAPMDYRFAAHPQKKDQLLDAIDFHLRKMKNDPDSVYHRRLDHLFGKNENTRVMKYLKIGLMVAGVFLLFAFIDLAILRYRVRARTSELAVKNRELEEELAKRVRAEKAQRSSEKRFRSLFESSTEGNAIHELVYDALGSPVDYKISDVNPAYTKHTGVQRQGVVGQYASQFYGTGEAPFLKRYADTAINGTPHQFETYFAPLKKHFRITVFSPAPGQFATEFEDITESKKMESRLLQAHKMQAIGTLAGGVAHDFNNILAAIIGHTELCKMKVEPDSDLNRNLDRIFEASQRARDLVNQILTFSRQKDQEKKPIEIKYCVREAMKLLQATIPSNIDIQVNGKTASGIVIADQTQIHQIIMNLCTNAAHAMQEKGGVLEIALNKIEVDANSAGMVPQLEPGAYMALTVSDTGEGIAPETLQRIFEPYFTTKEQGEGTGLGLSMVHGIVENLGGVIKVYSEPGSGTTVNIYLPCADTRGGSITATEAAVPGGDERILLVDDEAMILEMTRELLTQMGYRVTARTSSVEAFNAFQADPDRFDLVVTDQTMPNLTGKALAAKILGLRAGFPIILCTGFSTSINAEKALALGIRAFIKKPILRNELAAAVRQALDG
jgi:signal transduction histidine kinase/ActR/RegA family two-component response regulator